MKYIKTCEQLKHDKPLVLYHGSPKIFKNFKPELTFFSTTEDFAVEYADQKSFDQAMDAEPKLYVVELEGNIFDVRNPDHKSKLSRVLPDEVEFAYNNFGFTTNISREDILFRMSGKMVDEPYEPAVKANVGDEISDPSYEHDKYRVYKKDDEYAYAYYTKKYNWIIADAFKDTMELRTTRDYKPLFDEIKKYVDDIINKRYTGTHYIMPHERMYYVHALQNGDIDGGVYGVEVTSEESMGFKRKFEEFRKKVIKQIIETKDGLRRFNLKPRVVELSDTWRYYENSDVSGNIEKLGFDGYVAKENNVDTYAIYDPSKTTTIIRYEIPHGREFESWEDYENYIKYDRAVGEKIDINNLYRLNYGIIHTLYKRGVSVSDAIKIINDQIKNR